MNRAGFLEGLAVSGAAAALSPPGVSQADGQTILRPFASAPYPHASRAAGHLFEHKLYGATGSYSDATVAIFIPNGFRTGAGGLDFVVHFHGWRNDVRGVLGRYRLREQLVKSGRNAILIVPQGPKDAPDSGFGKLELDSGGFGRFVQEIASYLHASGQAASERVGRIVLTAHSGGYGGAGGVLTRGGIDDSIGDVILFDAAYDYFDAFATWSKANPANHFLSLFTDDTSTGNTQIMGMLQAAAPNLYVRLAETMTRAELQTRAPTFILTTSVAHDELMQKYDWYALFLQTTALSVITK